MTKLVKHEKEQTNRVFKELKETFGSLKNILEVDR